LTKLVRIDASEPVFLQQLRALNARDPVLWQLVVDALVGFHGMPWKEFDGEYWKHWHQHFSEPLSWGAFCPVPDKAKIYASLETKASSPDYFVRPLVFHVPDGL
jgi:hypothetical protein